MKIANTLQRGSTAAASFAKAHPYLVTMLLCLSAVLLYPLTQSRHTLVTGIILWIVGTVILGIFGTRTFEKKLHAQLPIIIWTGICCVMPLLSAAQWWTLCVLPCTVLLGALLIAERKMTDRLGGAMLCFMGFCMRLAYVLSTPYNVRQHDVGTFDGDSGHAAYITYLYENLQLPDFDVREVWQFYHPPLHHSISAAWMHLLTACGIPYEQAGENVQFLTLGFSCLCLVIFRQILRHFRLKGLALTIPMGILAFHPTFFLLAGSINNDILSITFLLASVLLTLRWYREPKLSTILKLACTIGLGMMTKLSVWMAAPAAAMVFLILLYRSRRQPLPYLKQFTLFGVVCVPLGLWWGIRNLVKWGVPIAYVPMLTSNSSQYVGDFSIWQRLFDFSPKQWLYVYDCFTMYGQSYNEYNPTLGLLKTAMFDELINSANYPAIRGFGEVLFFSQAVLGLLAAAAMVFVCIKVREGLDNTEKLQLCLTYAVTFLSYYSFCIIYAHTCTQNIRYATPLIFIGCLFLGLWMHSGRLPVLLKKVICAVSALFMLASYLVYACVCV